MAPELLPLPAWSGLFPGKPLSFPEFPMQVFYLQASIYAVFLSTPSQEVLKSDFRMILTKNGERMQTCRIILSFSKLCSETKINRFDLILHQCIQESGVGFSLFDTSCLVSTFFGVGSRPSLSERKLRHTFFFVCDVCYGSENLHNNDPMYTGAYTEVDQKKRLGSLSEKRKEWWSLLSSCAFQSFEVHQPLETEMW